MAAHRRATVRWKGSLMEGGGSVHLDSSRAASDLPVTWASRTESPDGKTSPEELIAAAHAGCFTMALANKLAEAGHPAEALDTRAEVDLSMEGGPSLSAIRLKLKANVPGIAPEKFRAVAEDAKENCPVSRALSAVPIALEAELLG